MSKKIIVTGSSGFLGGHVINRLMPMNYRFMPMDIKSNPFHDLQDINLISAMFSKYKPDVVIHLAAVVGGIVFNKNNQAGQLVDNNLILSNVMKCCVDHRVKKIISCGSVCAYPRNSKVPFREEDVLQGGLPEQTVVGYGLSKQLTIYSAQLYADQHNLEYVVPIISNMYGPGDNFDFYTGHVIPVTVKKFMDAVRNNEKEVICLGSGEITREFLYVEDMADIMVQSIDDKYTNLCYNVGSGEEIKIKDLINMIASKVGFKGNIVWDTNHSDGHKRRCVDLSRFRKIYPDKKFIQLSEGLDKTIKWYKETQEKEFLKKDLNI